MSAHADRHVLAVVLRCAPQFVRRARYVLETLLMSAGVSIEYHDVPPATGPWLLYGERWQEGDPRERALAIAHLPASWQLFDRRADAERAEQVDGLDVVFPEVAPGLDAQTDVRVDLLANAFYFLASWSERCGCHGDSSRTLYSASCFARLSLPQDVVDRYLDRLVQRLAALASRLGLAAWQFPRWPDGAGYAVVLSHDVDFIPSGPIDVTVQGAKTLLRHLLRQRDAADAARAMAGLAKAIVGGRDPYGCVPEIIAGEQARGVRSSFQVAVGHRHPADVNYRIEQDRTRDYLRAITDAGFDLCLHGSYRSTENPAWYEEEVALLQSRLARPRGSRQHFLSFDYDTLFAVQERCGIEYDMSMGFPDRSGPRAGFSYPYRPYDLAQDRPFRVLQISLFLMDVTLRGYMDLKGAAAWQAIDDSLSDLRAKGGCASVVWHPIVFGGARDPGFDALYWQLVDRVKATGGSATDGRSVHASWSARAQAYPTLAASA